jgi:hypothetical protein
VGTEVNYSLPGNPNPVMDREGAIGYLLDAALNGEETEWLSCSVRLLKMGKKTKAEVQQEVQECATLIGVQTDSNMIDDVIERIEENLL